MRSRSLPTSPAERQADADAQDTPQRGAQLPGHAHGPRVPGLRRAHAVLVRGGHAILDVGQQHAFDVIENSHDQVAISKQNSYAVARHVSSWTEVASKVPLLRIATVEYLLDKGQQLIQTSAALNGHTINATNCARMQARINTLSDPACITRHPLCDPTICTTGAGATLQTWPSYVLPLPAWHTDTTYKINTLLTTNDTVSNTKILSTLNFETRSPPQPACENAVPAATYLNHLQSMRFIGNKAVHRVRCGLPTHRRREPELQRVVSIRGVERRHRAVPGTRPVLARHAPPEPPQYPAVRALAPPPRLLGRARRRTAAADLGVSVWSVLRGHGSRRASGLCE